MKAFGDGSDISRTTYKRSAPCPRQITKPSSLDFYKSDALSATWPTMSKHCLVTSINETVTQFQQITNILIFKRCFTYWAGFVAESCSFLRIVLETFTYNLFISLPTIVTYQYSGFDVSAWATKINQSSKRRNKSKVRLTFNIQLQLSKWKMTFGSNPLKGCIGNFRPGEK